MRRATTASATRPATMAASAPAPRIVRPAKSVRRARATVPAAVERARASAQIATPARCVRRARATAVAAAVPTPARAPARARSARPVKTVLLANARATTAAEPRPRPRRRRASVHRARRENRVHRASSREIRARLTRTRPLAPRTRQTRVHGSTSVHPACRGSRVSRAYANSSTRVVVAAAVGALAPGASRVRSVRPASAAQCLRRVAGSKVCRDGSRLPVASPRRLDSKCVPIERFGDPHTAPIMQAHMPRPFRVTASARCR
jgi:hypothetical protein